MTLIKMLLPPQSMNEPLVHKRRKETATLLLPFRLVSPQVAKCHILALHKHLQWIWGPHSHDYEHYSLLPCNAV
jgi:hypothetical protein